MNKLVSKTRNMVGRMSANTRRAVASVAASAAIVLPSLALAEGETGVTATISTSFQSVVTETLSMIAAIAPIGITIFAAMFVWNYAKKAFKTITK